MPRLVVICTLVDGKALLLLLLLLEATKDDDLVLDPSKEEDCKVEGLAAPELVRLSDGVDAAEENERLLLPLDN